MPRELASVRPHDPGDLEWPKHVVFVKNTTEAINLVARGLFWEEGEVVITGDREHNSNRTAWWDLAKTRGILPKVIKRGGSDAPDAEFDVEAFLHELDEIDRHVGPVKLVSLAHIYNLDGYTIPDAALQQITAYCHSHDPDDLRHARCGSERAPYPGRCASAGCRFHGLLDP